MAFQERRAGQACLVREQTNHRRPFSAAASKWNCQHRVDFVAEIARIDGNDYCPMPLRRIPSFRSPDLASTRSLIHDRSRSLRLPRSLQNRSRSLPSQRPAANLQSRPSFAPPEVSDSRPAERAQLLHRLHQPDSHHGVPQALSGRQNSPDRWSSRSSFAARQGGLISCVLRSWLSCLLTIPDTPSYFNTTLYPLLRMRIGACRTRLHQSYE